MHHLGCITFLKSYSCYSLIFMFDVNVCWTINLSLLLEMAIITYVGTAVAGNSFLHFYR
jgi:hypothetical protein